MTDQRTEDRLSHDELVSRAVRWLERSCHCELVFGERWTTREIPDAIGWKRGVSIVLECKISTDDFYADRRKPWRLKRGLGLLRYYLTPPRLLCESRLPACWGLLECHPRQIRVIRRARQVPIAWWDHELEYRILVREIRRLREGWGRPTATGKAE